MNPPSDQITTGANEALECIFRVTIIILSKDEHQYHASRYADKLKTTAQAQWVLSVLL